MSLLKQTGTPSGTITAREVLLTGGVEGARVAQLTDEAALKLVNQDKATAEQSLETKQWALQWRESDILFQSPRTMAAWENGVTTRANVSRFTVAKHVNSLVPDMKSGLFYEDPPFVLRPRGDTTQQTARAKSELYGALLDEMEFPIEVELMMESQCLNGTGIAKWGCFSETYKQKKYVRKQSPAEVDLPFSGKAEVHTEESDEFDVREVERSRWRPFFEFKRLGQVVPSPEWNRANQIWKAKYIIEVAYPSFDDLNKLRQQDGYDIPSEAELKQIFFAPVETAPQPNSVVRTQSQNATIHHAAGPEEKVTEDPLGQPLEMVERWDDKRVMVVLQGKLVIRNEEHGLPRKPYLSCNWWNIQNAGFGMGVGRLVGQDQRVEQGSMNAALDILSLAVNQQAVVSRGANALTQQVRARLGGILTVDGDVDKAFKYAEGPKVPPEVWAAIADSRQASESTSGADAPFVQGNASQRGSSVLRSGTGAGGVMAASARRIQGPLGRFCENVFVPFLKMLDWMVNERMPLREAREILGDRLGSEFTFDHDNFLNASLSFEVLAGAHLAAKKAMAASLPMMIAILENPHLVQQLNSTGWTVDVKEIFEMFMEMSEWKNSRQVIRLMTADEAALFKQFNSAVQKAQADMAKGQQKFEADSRLIEQKTEGRMAEKLLMTTVDGKEEHARLAMEHAQEMMA